VKDANGCTLSTIATINNNGGPSAVVLTTTDANCGANNGSITIGTVTGGTSPYTYSFDGSAFTSTIVYNNLAAGSHAISVKDANGCTFSTNATINNNGGPSAVVLTATDANCGASNGSITIGTVTGGRSPYSFSIDGSAFTSTIVYNNLSAGSHTISAKDANGCTFSTNATINNSGGPTAIVVTKTDANCGANNGSITIGTVTGGTSPYAFSLDGGAYTSTLIYNNLAAGLHTISVKDANGCTFSSSTTINNSNGPTAVVVTPTNATCGASNGSITLGTVTGGTSPYTYSLDGSAYTSTLLYNNLGAGSHTISVKDANGCTFSTNATVNNAGGPISVTVFPKDSMVSEGARIQLNATSIATIFNWAYSPTLSNINIPNPVATIPEGSAGKSFTYYVTASTPAGCQGTASVTLKIYRGPDIYVPTGFTPNSDGKNDRFRPLAIGIKKLNYFRVFNRWGQVVFSTTALNEGWDGKLAGKDQSSDVYVWMVQGVTVDDKIISKKGTVVLIR